MATFVITQKLTLQEAVEAMVGIEQWFLTHPKHNLCRTDMFTITRGHLVEEVLAHTEDLNKKKK